jgi:hypothetical protein
MSDNSHNKYLKYKEKYLRIKNSDQSGGGDISEILFNINRIKKTPGLGPKILNEMSNVLRNPELLKDFLNSPLSDKPEFRMYQETIRKISELDDSEVSILERKLQEPQYASVMQSDTAPNPPLQFRESSRENPPPPIPSPQNTGQCKVILSNKDWGDLTSKLTKDHCNIFAVLNMANADTFGGGVLGGSAAQEENMFRRTDCYLYHDETNPDATLVYPLRTSRGDPITRRAYIKDRSNLINGVNNMVYLDKKNPRVCFKSREIINTESSTVQGYDLLPINEIFIFYELRAAAVRLTDPLNFNPVECRKRIKAQFETLRRNGIRHVVLSAFGCGAFKNPPEQVAEIYKSLIVEYINEFDVIAFAILWPGYGPNNYNIFKQIFQDNSIVRKLNIELDEIPQIPMIESIPDIKTSQKFYRKKIFLDTIEILINNEKYRKIKSLAYNNFKTNCPGSSTRTRTGSPSRRRTGSPSRRRTSSPSRRRTGTLTPLQLSNPTQNSLLESNRIKINYDHLAKIAVIGHQYFKKKGKI